MLVSTSKTMFLVITMCFLTSATTTGHAQKPCGVGVTVGGSSLSSPTPCARASTAPGTPSGYAKDRLTTTQGTQPVEESTENVTKPDDSAIAIDDVNGNTYATQPLEVLTENVKPDDSVSAIDDVNENTYATQPLEVKTKSVTAQDDSAIAIDNVNENLRVTQPLEVTTKSMTAQDDSVSAIVDVNENTYATQPLEVTTKSVKEQDDSAIAIDDVNENTHATQPLELTTKSMTEQDDYMSTNVDVKENLHATQPIEEQTETVTKRDDSVSVTVDHGQKAATLQGIDGSELPETAVNVTMSPPVSPKYQSTRCPGKETADPLSNPCTRRTTKSMDVTKSPGDSALNSIDAFLATKTPTTRRARPNVYAPPINKTTDAAAEHLTIIVPYTRTTAKTNLTVPAPYNRTNAKPAPFNRTNKANLSKAMASGSAAIGSTLIHFVILMLMGGARGV